MNGSGICVRPEDAIDAFTDAGLDYIGETFITYLSDEEYNKAFTTFARLSDKFLNQAEKGKPYDSGHMPKGSVSPFWIFGDLAIGILIALIWGNVKKAKLKSVKKQVAAQEYTKPGSLRLTMNSDRFVNRTVTTRVIQNNNSNSSGGGSSVHNRIIRNFSRRKERKLLVRTKEGDRVNERLYKRKIRLLISIVLVLVMAFSGCNGKQKKQERKRENRQESRQEKKETVKADNKDLSKSEQSLQNLQKNLRRSRMPMAAAYLGYADDNSPFRDQVRTLLKNGKYEEQYSFLADVPKENYISYNGEEVYAIVPQSTQYAMKVESFDWDENANAMVRDTLYISQKAAPVILKCNLSELSYNVVITLTKGTETFSYSPSLSLMDGALYAYNLDGMEIYDFTLYDNLEIPVWNEGGECGGCG